MSWVISYYFAGSALSKESFILLGIESANNLPSSSSGTIIPDSTHSLVIDTAPWELKRIKNSISFDGVTRCEDSPEKSQLKKLHSCSRSSLALNFGRMYQKNPFDKKVEYSRISLSTRVQVAEPEALCQNTVS